MFKSKEIQGNTSGKINSRQSGKSQSRHPGKLLAGITNENRSIGLTQILQLGRHPGKLLAGITNENPTADFHDPGQKIAGMTAQKSFQTLVSNVQSTEKFRLSDPGLRRAGMTAWLFLILLAGSIASLRAEPNPDTSKPAGGLRTDFGDVLIENLGIGKSYNLRDLAGMPMKVINTGAGPVDLVMDVVIPTMSFISALRREAGFEAIPSPDWVTLSQSRFIVPAGESALADVIITIPNDPALYGRKFQASIYSRTVGKGFVQLGVWSHLQMTLAESAEKQSEIEKNREQGFIGTMEYTLLPDKLVVLNFPLGRRVNVRKEIKKTMMLANSGDQAIDIRMRVVSIGSTPLTIQSGYEQATHTGWLKLKSEEFHVEPASFEDPGIEIEIPDKPEYRKKKYMFVIKVEPANPKILGVTYYGKVYVETQ